MSETSDGAAADATTQAPPETDSASQEPAAEVGESAPVTDPAPESVEAPDSPPEAEAPVTEASSPAADAETTEPASPDATEAAGPVSEQPEQAPSPEGAPEAAPETAPETAEPDASTPEAGGEDTAPVEKPSRPPRPMPEVIVAKPVADLPDDLSPDDFEQAVIDTVLEFKEGDIVEGTVVNVDHDEVLVDIGYKSEGHIPLRELSIRNNVDPGDVVAIGDRIEALVLDKEDDEGRLVLSKKRAQYERAWGRIQQITDGGGTVTGQVIEVVKGGLIVDIGLRGFLPASLVELRRVRDLDPYVGQELEAKVIELDRNRNNVVLSRRAFLEEAQAEQRHAFLDGLAPGEIREGVVSSVVNFGAFVDLGGMDGLVHVSELSFKHVSHPSEVVKVGDNVTVRVLEVDLDRERISLSIKQTQEDPWDAFARDHEVGDITEGVVTKTVPFGAFVSVAGGVEGLVHVSEIALHRVERPELELSVGQKVSVKLTEMDEERRRVSLSIKQALPGWRDREQSSPTRKRAPQVHAFEREEPEEEKEPAINVDSDLEAILQELKERGIGRR